MKFIGLVILSIFQLIFCCVIIALEAVNVSYNSYRGTIYAGFWCSCVSAVTSIMMCLIGMTERQLSNGSRIFLIILNLLNIISATVLIISTALFVYDPDICYGSFCDGPHTNSDKKSKILKALLIFGIIMFVNSLISLVVFMDTSSRQRDRRSSNIRNSSYEQPLDAAVAPASTYGEAKQLTSLSSEAHYYAPTNEMRSMKF